jgi:hypothetical protein
MTLTLTPNAEKAIATYLRTQPDVAAITDRVVATTGGKGFSTTTPWVRYTQLSKRSVGGHRSDHLNEVFIQLECYAAADNEPNDGLPGASLLARTVRAAMMDLPNAELPEAVVTGVEPRGDSRQPDTALNDRERFVLSFVVWLHA